MNVYFAYCKAVNCQSKNVARMLTKPYVVTVKSNIDGTSSPVSVDAAQSG